METYLSWIDGYIGACDNLMKWGIYLYAVFFVIMAIWLAMPEKTTTIEAFCKKHKLPLKKWRKKYKKK
tara:strand:- start:4068 stop:4271 length:204 start_codon:yes stop_codon:yes gene_type:complete